MSILSWPLTVDLDNKMLYIIKGKGDKCRTVPINDKLHPILVNYLENIRDVEVELGYFLLPGGRGGIRRLYQPNNQKGSC